MAKLTDFYLWDGNTTGAKKYLNLFSYNTKKLTIGSSAVSEINRFDMDCNDVHFSLFTGHTGGLSYMYENSTNFNVLSIASMAIDGQGATIIKSQGVNGTLMPVFCGDTGMLLDAGQSTLTMSANTIETSIGIGNNNGNTGGANLIVTDNAFGNCMQLELYAPDGGRIESTDLYLGVPNINLFNCYGSSTGTYVNIGDVDDYSTSTVQIVATTTTMSGKCQAAGGFFKESDERLKDIGENLNVDLTELSKIRKFHYEFKNNKGVKQIGVSAQEVQKLFPELVSEDENGYLSVNYSELSVIALAAIDKQEEQIKKQQSEIDNLKEEINELKKYIK